MADKDWNQTDLNRSQNQKSNVTQGQGQTDDNQRQPGQQGQTDYNQRQQGQGQTDYNQGQMDYNQRQQGQGQTDYNQRQQGQTDYNQRQQGQTDYNQRQQGLGGGRNDQTFGNQPSSGYGQDDVSGNVGNISGQTGGDVSSRGNDGYRDRSTFNEPSPTGGFGTGAAPRPERMSQDDSEIDLALDLEEDVPISSRDKMSGYDKTSGLNKGNVKKDQY